MGKQNSLGQKEEEEKRRERRQERKINLHFSRHRFKSFSVGIKKLILTQKERKKVNKFS